MSRDIRAEGHRVVRAPMQRVWQLVSRPETHPRQVRWWLAADVMERAQASTLVEFRGLFGGLPVTSVQRMTLRPPGRVDFKQVRGTLRNLSGAFVLKDRDGDTDVVIQMTVDAGISILSDDAVQQILVGGIEATLTGLKATAERDLARPTRRPQAPPDTEPAATGLASTAPSPPEHGDGREPSDADQADEDSDDDVAPTVEVQGAPSQSPGALGRRRRRRRGRGSNASRTGVPAASGPIAPAAAAGPTPRAGDQGRSQSHDDGPVRRRRRGRRGRGRGPGTPRAPGSDSAAPA